MVGPRAWKLVALVVATGGVVAWMLRTRRRGSCVPGDRTLTSAAEVAERADVVASSHVTDGSDASHVQREGAPEAGGESTSAARTFTAPAPEVTGDVHGDAVVDAPDAGAEASTETSTEAQVDASATELDLARIEHDLAGVEAALRRLDDGTYWTDEVTGDPLDDAMLLADPVARRNR